MKARLDRTLNKLAAQKAPHLLNHMQQNGGDKIAQIQWMARQLAEHRQVVLVGALEQEHSNVALHVHDWLRGFGQFCTLLTSTLYPSYTNISAHYADQTANPWIVVLELEVEPIASVLAGTIVPYLAWRQPQRPYSEPELRGLMDIVLREELSVSNLPSDDFYRLQQHGVDTLKHMLGVQMRYISVTTFDQPILNLLPRQQPQPPVMLPEEREQQQRRFTQELERVEIQEVDTTPSEQMFSPVPPITDLNKPVQPNRQRTAPVPGLPTRKS